MPDVSRRRLRSLHGQAAHTFAQADFLHRRLREELLSRLDFVALEPRRVLDLGCGPGAAFAGLQGHFPDACLIGIDHAPAMLQAAGATRALQLCGDAHRLPLPDGSIDLVFCNLTLAYCPNPVPVLAEIRRVLAEPGLVLFSTLGPDTLVELRKAWAPLGDHTHIVRFPDMHDLGDLVVRAGLAEPVLDRESLTVSYPNLAALRAELRAVGSINRTAGRNQGLTGREKGRRMLSALEPCRDAGGRLSLTVEVVCGQGWAGAPASRRAGPETSVPVDQITRRGI